MPEQKENQICIVTVTGKDRVGIVARLATVMAKANVNIVDINQKIMEEFRPRMKVLYYDPSKYDTYLEQLGIKYPTVR